MKFYIKKGDAYPRKKKTFGVFLEKTPGFGRGYYLWKAYIHVNHQYFCIGAGDKSHCEFALKMFKKALSAHDKEKHGKRT